MSFLHSIRKRSGLLIGSIGVALVAFILTDFLNSSTTLFREDYENIGFVNGEPITRVEFQQKVQEQVENLKRQYGGASNNMMDDYAREQVWTRSVQSILINQKVESMGMDVGTEHIWNAIVQMPQIANAFKDSVSGGVDPLKVKQYVSYLQQNANTSREVAMQWIQWLKMEQNIKEQLKQQQIIDIIAQAYTPSKPTLRVKAMLEKQRRDVQYVFKSYNEVIDTLVKVSQKDIKDYIQSHKGEFEKEARKSIHYAIVDLNPSLLDIQAVREDLDNLKRPQNIRAEDGSVIKQKGFAQVKDVASFVNEYSDQTYVPNFVKESKLDVDLKKELLKAKKNQVIGPKIISETVKMARLLDTRMLPDTAKIAHILIAHSGVSSNSAYTRAEAKKVADSLLAVLQKSPKQFDAIREDYSDDKQSDNGVLGSFALGQLDTQLERVAFENKPNTIKLVDSRYGFQIVKVLSHKGKSKSYKVATIVRRVTLSDETYKEKFQKLAKISKQGIDPQEYRLLANGARLENQVFENFEINEMGLTAVQDTRDVIRWAFEQDRQVGDVRIFEKEGMLISVLLTDQKEKGLATVEEATPKVTPILRKQKKKKLLISQFKKAETLKAIAKANQLEVLSSAAIAMTNPMVNKAGRDPKFISAVFGAKLKVLEGPVAGDQGVYYFMATKESKPDTDKVSLSPYKTEYARVLEPRRIVGQILGQMTENAEVEDFRYKFY